jgi:hypothetical protein
VTTMSKQLPKRKLNYLNRLYNQLPKQTQKNVIDYLEFLVQKNKSTDLKAIWDNIPEVDEPLTAEEEKILQEEGEYLTGEEAKREFKLRIDLP